MVNQPAIKQQRFSVQNFSKFTLTNPFNNPKLRELAIKKVTSHKHTVNQKQLQRDEENVGFPREYIYVCCQFVHVKRR